MEYKITLLFIPRSVNYYNAHHWNKKYHDKKKIEEEFYWTAIQAKLPVLKKVHVTHQFYLKGKRPFTDIDNAGMAVKFLHDALKQFMEGDDTSGNLSFTVLPFIKDEKQRWEVKIIEME